MTDAEVRAKAKAIIEDYTSWPVPDVLFLKKYELSPVIRATSMGISHPERRLTSFGHLTRMIEVDRRRKGKGPCVFPHDAGTFEPIEFDSVDELLIDGWTVD